MLGREPSQRTMMMRPTKSSMRFENGARMVFARHLLEGLGAASADQLRAIVIAGPGTGL
jgi:hypothetical protein